MPLLDGFKVSLVNCENGLGGKLTRRIDFEQNSNSLLILRRRLYLVFPELQGKDFTLAWKDSEDDYVDISTDYDLHTAIRESKHKSSLKLYVSIKTKQKKNTSENHSDTVHPGVLCDVCDKNVQGFRYKCIECPDYDLCKDCESQGYHTEHCMIRMAVPLEWSSHHGRRLAYHLRKFMRKSLWRYEHDVEDAEEAGEVKDRTSKGCRTSKKDKRHCGKTYGVANILSNFMSEFINTCDQIGQKVPSKTEEKESPESNETPKRESCTDCNVVESYMKSLEKKIMPILDTFEPLAFSLVVPEENMYGANTPPNDQNKKADAQQPSSSGENISAKFPGEGRKLRDVKNNETDAMAQEKLPDSQEVTSTGENINEKLPSEEKAVSEKEKSDNGTANNVASTSKNNGSVEKSPDYEGWTFVTSAESPNVSSSSSVSSVVNETIPKQLETPEQVATPKQVTPIAPEERRQESIYPPLPQEHVVYHSNPKIQRAVEAMMSMGFSNECGWLTQLLVSKDGDICKALDVLQPVRP